MKNFFEQLTYKKINAFLLMMAIATMSVAYFFMQKYLKLEACPLCIFQRIGMIGMGAVALVALLINAKKLSVRLFLWLVSLLSVIWSTVVAGRHVWLQHLPADEVPSCGPGLNYWLDVLPILQVLEEVFRGSGECAEISWKFLGLSIPEQALIVFVFLLIVHFVLLKVIIKK